MFSSSANDTYAILVTNLLHRDPVRVGSFVSTAVVIPNKELTKIEKGQSVMHKIYSVESLHLKT